MDDSGRIQKFESNGEAMSAGFKTKLSLKEAEFLQNFPPSERHRELSVMRFMEHHERRHAGQSLRMRLINAFIQGWEARETEL